ncbi:unnamed protein product [Urochloa humidicola]
MGCGGSKEAVVKSNSGSSRCNRFRKKSSVVADATQPCRAPPPSDNGSAVVAKANDKVRADAKGNAATSSQKAIEEEKEGINNKADQVVKDSKGAFTVNEGNATSTANAILDKKEDEIKKDEAIIKDAKEEITIEKDKEALTEKATKDKEQEDKKIEVLKDKMVTNQKADIAPAENVIAEEKEDAKNDDDVESSTGVIEDKKNEVDNKDIAIATKENDGAALTENDSSTEDDIEENKEDFSVTFPVAMVTEEDGSVTFRVPDDTVTKDDDSVTFATASATKTSNMVAIVPEEDGRLTFAVPVGPVTKDDDSVTFAAATTTKDNGMVVMASEEDGSVIFANPVAPVTKDGHVVTFTAAPATKNDSSVTLAAAPTSKDEDNDIVTLTVAPGAKEENVAEQPEPSEDSEEAKNEAELQEPTVFENKESMTEVDGTTEGEGVAEKSKPSEDNGEVKNEAELPDPNVVEQVVTEVVEALKVEEGMVDNVGEIKVEQDEESVSKEPEEENSSAVLRDEDGESNGKQTIDSKETITSKEKAEELSVPEKEGDDEKAPAPSALALN